MWVVVVVMGDGGCDGDGDGDDDVCICVRFLLCLYINPKPKQSLEKKFLYFRHGIHYYLILLMVLDHPVLLLQLRAHLQNKKEI